MTETWRWTFVAVAPDGRELDRETGGPASEARIRGVVGRFNARVPRGGRLAQVKMEPATFGPEARGRT
jgi:hypothetical protein